MQGVHTEGKVQNSCPLLLSSPTPMENIRLGEMAVEKKSGSHLLKQFYQILKFNLWCKPGHPHPSKLSVLPLVGGSGVHGPKPFFSLTDAPYK